MFDGLINCVCLSVVLWVVINNFLTRKVHLTTTYNGKTLQEQCLSKKYNLVKTINGTSHPALTRTHKKVVSDNF